MKKITTFAMLPLITLASCSKDTTPVVTPEANPVANEAIPEANPVANETLNTQITTTTNETGIVIKQFRLTYDLPDGQPLAFNGDIEIENGKIKSINFPEYDLSNDASYEVKFAKAMQVDLIGKEIKWLQYDGMSGASLTTDAFNKYLTTINQ